MKPIPFLRVIFPFLFGILINIYYEFSLHFWSVFLCLSITLIGFVVLQITKRLKKMSFVFADAFLLLLGCLMVFVSNLKNDPNNILNQINDPSETAYLASVKDIPIDKKKFIKCELQISHLLYENKWKPINGNLIAYFKKPFDHQKLVPGQLLYIKSRLQTLSQPKNPMEFNYANYMAAKNVFHTTYVTEASMMVLDANHSNLNWVQDFALRVKYQLVNQLRQSALNQNAFAICSALITGYDDEIDQSVVQAFAHSGTLHILSVSGLHTGLIYLLLNFIFNLFDPYQKLRRTKFFVITILLWSFALLTGFSAPVLRAVIMFTLLGFGKLFYRSNAKHQLNILTVSAFILLLYNPYYLVNMGFLLSYGAMIGIIVFTPYLSKVLHSKNKILNYIFESIAVSMAATISTLPLTLFFFKQFPIWFFVCNLLVVPLSFVILLLAFLSLFQLPFLVQLINTLVNFMIDFIQIFNQGSWTYIDCIHFRLRDFIFLSLIIIFIFFAIKERQFKFSLATVLLLIVWQFSSIIDAWQAKSNQFVTVYHVKHKSRILVKNKERAFYNHFDSASFNYHLKPHFTSFNYAQLAIQTFNFIQTKKQNILILDSIDFLPSAKLNNIHTIVLANNFILSEQDFKKFEKLKMVIVDASNKTNIIYKTENLCRKFGIPFYNTSLKGAYTMALE